MLSSMVTGLGVLQTHFERVPKSPLMTITSAPSSSVSCREEHSTEVRLFGPGGRDASNGLEGAFANSVLMSLQYAQAHR